MKKLTNSIAFLILTAVLAGAAFAHCEIPCGIYDDAMRIDMLSEHIATIEKSINMIRQLSKEEKINYNQLVRWIMNKEKHADYFQEIVTQYFLTQRIKLTDKTDEQAYQHYLNQVTALHEMLVYAMKTKQSTDLSNIDKLKTVLEMFEKEYFAEKSGHQEKKSQERHHHHHD